MLTTLANYSCRTFCFPIKDSSLSSSWARDYLVRKEFSRTLASSSEIWLLRRVIYAACRSTVTSRFCFFVDISRRSIILLRLAGKSPTWNSKFRIGFYWSSKIHSIIITLIMATGIGVAAVWAAFIYRNYTYGWGNSVRKTARPRLSEACWKSSRTFREVLSN